MLRATPARVCIKLTTKASAEAELFQVTEICRDGSNLCFSQAMRDWLHDGGIVGFAGSILTPLFAPVKQFLRDVVIKLTCQTRKRVGSEIVCLSEHTGSS